MQQPLTHLELVQLPANRRQLLHVRNARDVEQLAHSIGAFAIGVDPSLHLPRLGLRDGDTKEAAEDGEELGDHVGRNAEVGDKFERCQIDVRGVVAVREEFLFWWLRYRLILGRQLSLLLELHLGHLQLSLQITPPRVGCRALDVAADLAREGLCVCLLISRCLSLACLRTSVGEVRIREGPLVEGAASVELLHLSLQLSDLPGWVGLGWAGLGRVGLGWAGLG